MSEITFRRFKEEDIEPCTSIMKEAFDEDSMLFREVPDGPPGYDDGIFLKMNAVDSSADSFCIYVDGKLIGEENMNIWVILNVNIMMFKYLTLRNL